ncbi:fibrocystin-L-like [Ruditapes philippinarum]|uniref:fibrocystin-L-like n=1 Tax=Ruditapes philippinarum TaxID=129788 RepID=UPI00295B2730|nr:fibrocystin-L-like [Ruditapes philippinarum]
MFQQYADITNISHSNGSVAGGLILTIYGRHFGGRLSSKRAYIDDTPCVVTEVMPGKHITCHVAAKPEILGSDFEGNRGVNYEYWTNMTIDGIETILWLDNLDPGYNFQRLDAANLDFDDVNGTRGRHAGKFTFYFKPPHTGHYRITVEMYMRGGGAAKLYMDGVEKMSSSFRYGHSRTMDVILHNEVKYLFQLIYHSTEGSVYMNTKAKYYNTTFTNTMVKKADQEQQRIKITSTVLNEVQDLVFIRELKQNHVFEVQTVTIDSVSHDLFRFGLYGVFTEPLSISFTEKEIQDSLLALPIWGPHESVSVKRSYSPALSIPTFTYEITFITTRGKKQP